jgi:hypothetical protein|tara:strand:- start:2758 stop:4362 length:1605 start_codon:yes stop_codon:yes gene_type:complete
MLDIFYLTYKHDYSKEHFERIKELAHPEQNVLHVKDIDGIYNAHKECARQSTTSHFFVIDGDGWVLDTFDFSYIPSETDEVYPETCSAQCTHVWRALNPATGKTYGYGGIKLFAKEAFFDKAWAHIEFPGVDVTTEVAKRGFPYLPIDVVSNETRFNSSAFNAWKGAFRECTKLASGIATENRRQKIKEWKNPQEKISFRSEVLLGAIMGENYGTVNTGKGDRLHRINNWKWLNTWFKQRKNWKPSPVVEVDSTYPDGRYMLNGIQRYAEWVEHPDVDDIDLMRLAVMDTNKEHQENVYNAIEKLIWEKKYNSEHMQMFLQYLYSGVRNRFNPERCLHFMYEYFSTKSDPYFGLLMGAAKEAPDCNYIDAHSNYQVESKIWLIERLITLNKKFDNAVFIGGWLGISSFWSYKKDIMNNITNIDIDEDAIKFSKKLNEYNHGVKSIVDNADEHDYSEYDLVINTSSEHMTEDWFKKVKKGTTVALQTNDFHDIVEHINTVNNLKELEEKYPMSEVLFSGTKDCDRYNRFMLIGIK